MKRLAPPVLVFLISLSSVLAQTQPEQTFKAAVNVIQVPVVVRDRDGRAVSDLKKEDFQLFDNGKLQEVASFSVEVPHSDAAPDRSLPSPTPGATPSAPVTGVDIPTRFVAYLFDDLSIRDPGDLTRIRKAAAQQFSALQPGDRAGILTSSCRVGLDFTNDPQKLQEAVSGIELHPAPVCRFSQTQQLQVELLKNIVGKMAKLPARREIVLVSAGFFVGHDRTDEQDELVEAAVHAKVVIDAVDVGESVAYRGPDAGTSRSQSRSRGSGQGNNTNPLVLVQLAHGTGGTYLSGNDFAVSFRQLATPETYYVLGFVPDAKPDGHFHQLKVKIDSSRKMTVEARSGYFAPQRTE